MPEPTFKSLEHIGWEERARFYDEATAVLTDQTINPLLDAVPLMPGHAVLDMCCGTGQVAAALRARGAVVTGLDFSSSMVALARTKAPDIRFEVGDAEAMPFGEASFDHVVCNFGLYHLADPDAAIAEAGRVLRPGGMFAFTTWCGPEVSPLFRLIPEAIREHGRLDVGLPPAPPPFRLADPEESRSAMRSGGFTDVEHKRLDTVFVWPEADAIAFLYKSTVRMTMLLDRQEESARRRIEEAISEHLHAHATKGVVRMPMPSMMVRGTKSAGPTA